MSQPVEPSDEPVRLEPLSPAPDLPPRVRSAGVVAWCSFLAAGAATTVAFALLDPHAVSVGEVPSWWQGRLAVYAIGFFFFWAIAAAASALTVYMIRTEHADSAGGG